MKFKKVSISIALTLAFGLLSNSAIANNDKLPLKEISKIAEVFSIIDSRYVEDVNKSDLMLNALSGMVSGLDPYSHYLTSKDVEKFSHDISGENVGLGIIIVKDENGIKIETVLKDSPAERAGLESSDIIIKINDDYIIDKYENPLMAVEDLTGEIGSKVNISVQKAFDKSIVDLTIERDKFVSPSTTVSLINNDYGYAYISSFQENTQKELTNEFKKFKKNHANVKGFIIDLRSNPGGLLNSAVGISDLFLNKGKIVSTKGRFDDSLEEKYATTGDILNGKPIVVLINSGTASAAEILAGALQDNKRALIVGQTSYGKGSVQTLFPLNGSDGDFVKMTIARYYTPSGRSIQAEGISPDITTSRVSNIDVIDVKRLREKDNKNHISNDTNYKAENGDEKKGMQIDIKNDYQLYEALNALKALTVFK